jgi:solute carrier family 35 (UDP-sugar transporter), member A1/2/3
VFAARFLFVYQIYLYMLRFQLFLTNSFSFSILLLLIAISAQLKILTTAACSVLILHTKLSMTKWRALGLLVVGCILVISPSLELQQKSSDGVSPFSVLVFGYGAVLTEVLLSGFASIYFEKVVKSTTEVVTIWERNMQLSFYSIIIYLFMIFYDCNFSETPKVLGQNWSGLTLLVAFLGAFGGLLVAATLKYADAILKTLSTAGAIVVSTVLGHFMLGSPLNYIMALGASCVIFAIFNYTLDATPPPAAPPASVSVKVEPSDSDSDVAPLLSSPFSKKNDAPSFKSAASTRV